MFVLISLLLVATQSLYANTNTKALSTKVIELRKEVELLNDEYKTEREKVLNELKSLSIQKAELASNIRNEEIRKKQLIEKIDKLKKDIGQSSIESKELEPVIEKTLAELEAWVEGSLPFKQSERLATIKTLKDRIAKKEVSIIKAANQLFALIEDEKRLGRETSLHRQTIPVNGKMQLAEVVKVGMLLMYFKTEKGDVGLVTKGSQGWVYSPFVSEAKQTQTIAFFESLKKQIRQGYFELPTSI